MQLLAAVEGDGAIPLTEALVASVQRIRRGMTAVIITASLDRDWVKPLAALRSRGVACVVVALDVAAFERHARETAAREQQEPVGFVSVLVRPEDEAPTRAAPAAATSSATSAEVPESEIASAKHARALRHALAEYEIAVYQVGPTSPLAKALAS
jgi:hypothetical protein